MNLKFELIHIAVNCSIVVVVPCQGRATRETCSCCSICSCMLLWCQTFLQSRFQVLPIAQLLRRVPHNLIDRQFEVEIEFLDLFKAFNAFFHILFLDSPSNLTMSFGSLSQLLPLLGVTRSCNVGGWLLSEHILNG